LRFCEIHKPQSRAIHKPQIRAFHEGNSNVNAFYHWPRSMHGDKFCGCPLAPELRHIVAHTVTFGISFGRKSENELGIFRNKTIQLNEPLLFFLPPGSSSFTSLHCTKRVAESRGRRPESIYTKNTEEHLSWSAEIHNPVYSQYYSCKPMVELYSALEDGARSALTPSLGPWR